APALGRHRSSCLRLCANAVPEASAGTRRLGSCHWADPCRRTAGAYAGAQPAADGRAGQPNALLPAGLMPAGLMPAGLMPAGLGHSRSGHSRSGHSGSGHSGSGSELLALRVVVAVRVFQAGLVHVLMSVLGPVVVGVGVLVGDMVVLMRGVRMAVSLFAMVV